MNYKQIYENIINNARIQKRKKCKEIYYERHHILPKCMGGSNKNINLVLLTAKEHFICHKLLTYIYPDEINLKRSVNFMIHSGNKDKRKEKRFIRFSSKEYEYSKILYKQLMIGEKNPFYGKHHTEESKKLISKNLDISGIKNPFYGKHHTEETKYNIGKKNRLNIKTKEQRNKCRDGQLKRYKFLKENNMCFYTISKCPHCGMEGRTTNIKRYHFDNCKHKNIIS